MKTENKIIIILGPTASGKSELAVKIAQHFKGEIISADSRQVFKGMEINSGAVKVNKGRYKNIPHYLISFLDPEKDFNVSNFQEATQKLIKTIIQKNKLPIICGGSLFWIDALIKNRSFPAVKPNPVLRKKLSLKTTSELFQQLQKLDPQRAQNIDRHNKMRLIRALEIIEQLGKVPPLAASSPNPHIKYLLISPYKDWNTLQKRIRQNVKKRLQQEMIEEIEKLHYQRNISWEKIEKLGLSFRLIPQFLRKEIKTKKELEEKIYLAEKNYAKRQLTWMKKIKNINYVSNTQEAQKIITDFLA